MRLRRWQRVAMMFAALVLGATLPLVAGPYWVKFTLAGGGGIVGSLFHVTAVTNAPLGSGYTLRIIRWPIDWEGNMIDPPGKKVAKECNSGRSCTLFYRSKDPATWEFQAEVVQDNGDIVASSSVERSKWILGRLSDIGGTWFLSDGQSVLVTQTGDRVNWKYRGGGGHATMTGTVTGIWDGREFKGTYVNHEGSVTGQGTINLTLVGDSRLQGPWFSTSAIRNSGQWVMTRQKP